MRSTTLPQNRREYCINSGDISINFIIQAVNLLRITVQAEDYSKNKSNQIKMFSVLLKLALLVTILDLTVGLPLGAEDSSDVSSVNLSMSCDSELKYQKIIN
jgi:hypothetical protein